jgi:hypothetical protein
MPSLCLRLTGHPTRPALHRDSGRHAPALCLHGPGLRDTAGWPKVIVVEPTGDEAAGHARHLGATITGTRATTGKPGAAVLAQRWLSDDHGERTGGATRRTIHAETFQGIRRASPGSFQSTTCVRMDPRLLLVAFV